MDCPSTNPGFFWYNEEQRQFLHSFPSRNHHIQSSQAEMRLIICFGSAGVRRSLTSETIFPARCLEDSTNPTWRSNHQNEVSKLFNFAHKLPFQKKLRHHVCGVNVSVLSDLTMLVASYHPQCTILNPGSSQLDPHGVKANGQWLAKHWFKTSRSK